MKLTHLILSLTALSVQFSGFTSAQETKWMVLAKLDTPMRIPKADSVGDGIRKTLDALELTAEIPSELSDVPSPIPAEWHKSLVNVPIMARSCLAVFLDKTDYDFMVKNGELSIVKRTLMDTTEYARKLDLWGMSVTDQEYLIAIVPRLIAPGKWKSAGGECEIELINGAGFAALQCDKQMHEQIELFTHITRSHRVELNRQKLEYEHRLRHPDMPQLHRARFDHKPLQ